MTDNNKKKQDQISEEQTKEVDQNPSEISQEEKLKEN